MEYLLSNFVTENTKHTTELTGDVQKPSHNPVPKPPVKGLVGFLHPVPELFLFLKVLLGAVHIHKDRRNGGDYVKVATINSSRVRPLNNVRISVPAQSASQSNYMISVMVNTSGEIKIYKNTTSTGTYCGQLTWIMA